MFKIKNHLSCQHWVEKVQLWIKVSILPNKQKHSVCFHKLKVKLDALVRLDKDISARNSLWNLAQAKQQLVTGEKKIAAKLNSLVQQQNVSLKILKV